MKSRRLPRNSIRKRFGINDLPVSSILVRSAHGNSFDHLVGAGEQRRWHGEAELFGSFEIDRQLVVGRVLHRKIGRLLALEDAINVNGGEPVRVGRVGRVGDEAAAADEVGAGVDRRQRVLGRERDDQIAMKHRDRAPQHDQTAVRARANSMTAPSISGAFPPPIELNTIPSDGATYWSTANCEIPAGRVGSRSTATRVTRGAISLSSSSHFPLVPYSIDVKPVALPPGRAAIATT